MTKYLKEEDMNETAIFEVAKALQEGKLVVFPTDTVYGIGTNAYHEEACLRIYEVKGRPKQKPLIVLISNLSMLKELVDGISPIEQKLMDTFWPESLTIKYKKKKGILPDLISAGDDYVRIRLVKNGIIFKLIEESKVPIVAPSANLSGSVTGTKIKNIIYELGGKVDYIIDCGDIESDEVSTIIQVEKREILLIREGKIKKEDLEKIAPLRKL